MRHDPLVRPIITSALKLAEAEGLGEENRRAVREHIGSIGPKISESPREQTYANAEFLYVLARLLFARAQILYGNGAHDELIFEPYFGSHASQVFPVSKEPLTFGVVIGAHAKTWEAVFYELAHEMLHFLNPVQNIREQPIATLEEGVAVKFAESVYSELVSAYTGRSPAVSPVAARAPQYYPAFSATKKLPDAVLATVRDHFGCFHTVNDPVAFASLVDKYLDPREIELLLTPFQYGPQVIIA